MKNVITFILLILAIVTEIVGQQEKLEIEGAIQIGSSQDPTPDPGTIRWTGYNFEGYTGSKWVALTQFNIASIITDIDGNEYRTVQIGTQEWMAQNLRSSRYRNNDAIPNIPNDTDWSNLGSGAWCWNNNDQSNEQPYGKLYNWYAVDDARGLCPSGWHVPKDTEWKVLRDYLDPNAMFFFNDAGGKMKEPGLAHWITLNIGSTNSSSFSGLPGGHRFKEGLFSAIGFSGFWWSSTELGINDGFLAYLDALGRTMSIPNDHKASGFSIRCLKD